MSCGPFWEEFPARGRIGPRRPQWPLNGRRPMCFLSESDGFVWMGVGSSMRAARAAHIGSYPSAPKPRSMGKSQHLGRHHPHPPCCLYESHAKWVLAVSESMCALLDTIVHGQGRVSAAGTESRQFRTSSPRFPSHTGVDSLNALQTRVNRIVSPVLQPTVYHGPFFR